MKKAFVSTVTALVMACSLGACAGKQEAAAPAEPEQEAAATATATEEDGQNPIMNFIGPYARDRANVLIEADGTEGARVTVTWANDASETTEWKMSGPFDPNTLTITYEGGTKTVRTFNEDGSVANEEVAYTDGTGSIVFTTEGSTKLKWDDAKEHVADGMEFTWNF